MILPRVFSLSPADARVPGLEDYSAQSSLRVDWRVPTWLPTQT
jgi:hypothetical protein